MDQCLIIFAKAPRLGTIKTRLQSALPPELIRRLYVAFVRDTLAMAGRVSGADRRVVAFSPADGEPSLRRAVRMSVKGFHFLPQEGPGLGDRLGHAFERSFRDGATRTVIIGSDSPTLPAPLVAEAFVALRRHDLVLGPSTDGGFYLIGKRVGSSKSPIELLGGIEWSSERVLQQTIAAARRARLNIHLLAPWYDVDDVAGLRFLRTHLHALALCGSAEVAWHTWRGLRGLRTNL